MELTIIPFLRATYHNSPLLRGDKGGVLKILYVYQLRKNIRDF
jgi:hypothetical protein